MCCLPIKSVSNKKCVGERLRKKHGVEENQLTSKKQCKILSGGKQWMKKLKQFRRTIHGNSLFFRNDTKPSESSGCIRQRRIPTERLKDTRRD
ncbi:hypothetical protein ACFX2I_035443 [Malus domestica]